MSILDAELGQMNSDPTAWAVLDAAPACQDVRSFRAEEFARVVPRHRIRIAKMAEAIIREPKRGSIHRYKPVLAGWARAENAVMTAPVTEKRLTI